MTLEVSIEPTVEADLVELSANIRDIDAKECQLMLNLPVAQAVKLSFAVSYESYTGRVNGELVTIFGIARPHTLSGEGIPWLLGTPLVEKYTFTFLRKSRKIVRGWGKRHPVMKNYVYVENETSIQWLRWLGFKIKDPVPYGASGEMFHPFELRS